MISVERKLSTAALTQISKSFRVRRSSLKLASFNVGLASSPDTNRPPNKPGENDCRKRHHQLSLV